MDGKNEAMTQAEFAGKEWVPISVTRGKLVMRGGHSPAENLLIRQARERLSQHGDTVRALEAKGWTVGDVHFLRSGMLDLDLQMRTDLQMSIEAHVLIEGHEVTYSLIPEGDAWNHHFDGFGEDYGAEHGVIEFGPVGVIASPAEVWRLLVDVRDSKRRQVAWMIEQQLRAECGPGEEPDPEEVHELLARPRSRHEDLRMLHGSRALDGDETFTVKRPEGAGH
jgi:hypothetical protein